MAPEQSLGEAVDHRADLYALGVTFYEMLTGRVPFRDGDVAFHHRHTPVPDPRELVPDLPAAWAALLLALMAKNPEERPPSAAAVAERLAQLTGIRSEP
jgi:serine/threonine-protein kinase